MSAGETAEGELVKLCQECGAPRPRGRVKFCSDNCWKIATARATRLRDDARVAACKRCGGPKEPGIRGGRYCIECRRIIADSSQAAEFERARRRSVQNNATKVANGGRVKYRKIEAPDGQKWCARCQEFRPLTSFPQRKDRAAGPYCKPCQRAYNQERRLLINFGLTWDEYDFLLASQDYRCAICRGKPRKHSLSVDHDHKTGEIRGLLCSRCNHRLLGSANDDPARLRAAADYLEAFTPRDVFGDTKLVPGFQRGAAA